MDKLKILFMGTPEFSVNIVEALIKEYDVVGIVTQPDKEVGRHKEIKFSPVKEVAIKHNIPVFQPVRLREEYEQFLNMDIDMIVTCAYGQMVPVQLLDYPKYKAINVHASLLPKLRGGAPIHKAIINNYARTGVTIMYMAPKMDAGDIISQVETEILPTDNLESLHDRLSILGTKLLIETIHKIVEGSINPIAQNEDEVTYAYNITREEEKIDFNKSIIDIFNQIRGLSPTPGAYAILDGEVVKKDLAAGQVLKVDNGYVAAMTSGVDLDITTVPGLKNIMFGGEGLFLTTVKGPGTVYLQSMPISKLQSLLYTGPRN